MSEQVIRQDITWEKAPNGVPPLASPQANRQRMYKQLAQECKDNPGEPYVVRGFSSPASATQMRKGKYQAIDPNEFTIEVRRNKDGIRYDIYLTYIGEAEEV